MCVNDFDFVRILNVSLSDLKKKKMLSLRVYLVSVFTILLGMVISSSQFKEKNKLFVALGGLIVLILLFRSDFIFYEGTS